MLFQAIKDTVKALRSSSIKDVTNIVLSSLKDMNTDASLGIDSSKTKSSFFGSQYEAQQNATFYAPTRAEPFIEMWKTFGLEPRGRFVDFGSGKGRVLVLAHKVGFESVVGLELDSELVELSKKNLSTVSISAEIYHQSFCEYTPSEEDTCYYIYDPCSLDFLKKTLTTLKEKLQQQPVHLIYYNNLVSTDVAQSTLPFKLKAKGRFQGNQFFLFKNE